MISPKKSASFASISDTSLAVVAAASLVALGAEIAFGTDVVSLAALGGATTTVVSAC